MLNYGQLLGENIKPEDLRYRISHGLHAALQTSHRLIKLDELKQHESDDIFILTFELDVPSRPQNKIKGRERIAIVVKSDVSIPKVFALREDFPLGLSHTNLYNHPRPVDLCIYEETFQELKLNWSGIKFLYDIKYWLEATATGDLHQADQPLEPFFVPSGVIIYNPEIKAPDLIVQLSNNTYKLHTLESVKKDESIRNSKRILIYSLESKEIEHGLVNSSPSDLVELEEKLESLGIDLSAEIKSIIDGVLEDANGQEQIQLPFALILKLNLRRGAEGDTESTRWNFFKINESLLDIGLKTDYLVKSPYNETFTKANILQRSINLEGCTSVGVELLNPHHDFTYDFAKGLNNVSPTEESTFSLIGVGALGAQFLNNMVRQGIGKWNVFDHDTVLPHNLTRHHSNRYGIGQNKAHYASYYINSILFPNENIVTAYRENVTRSYERVEKPLFESDYIIDISTSIAVERMLAARLKANRKFTAFINPRGNELVLFSEDQAIETSLDLIEFQYYKEILQSSELHDHYSFEENSSVRYARGCRDITSRISQSNLSIFSGILSKAIRKNTDIESGSLEIWQLSDDFSINKLSFPLDGWVEKKCGDWTINMNQLLIAKMQSFRESKLPNETGGILLGGIDTHHRKIYLVDSILSPKDSVEKRTIYIRGIDKVTENLENISKLTNNSIRYLGEWHSHPDGCSLNMSPDDSILFTELLDEAQHRGVPTLMLIQGRDSFNLYIGNHEF